MRVMLEEDWKRLWCPHARSPYLVDRNVASCNRYPTGRPYAGTECVGSACAAWDWEVDPPADGFIYQKYSMGAYSAKKYNPDNLGLTSHGFVFMGVECRNPDKSEAYQEWLAIWRKPWQPRGTCAAFHKPIPE